MNMVPKKGISLVVLLITIVVMIIVASTIIINLSNNGTIQLASKYKFQTDLKSFQTELEIYKNAESIAQPRMFNPLKLQADENSVIYNGKVQTGKTIYDVIPSLEKAKDYQGKIVIESGELIYKSADAPQKDWATEIGVNVVTEGTLNVNIFATSETSVLAGTDVTYQIRCSSNAAITSVNLENNLEVINNTNTALEQQPNIVIGSLSGTNTDTSRDVSVTIKTDNITPGQYKLRVKAGSVTDANNVSNTEDVTSPATFSINKENIVDITPPDAPTIAANSTSWTNEDVAVTITYPDDATVKQYSSDGVNWNNYDTLITVNTNNTTIYAKCSDAAGNTSKQSSYTISNIDKVVPTITFGTNGANNIQTANTTVTVNDAGGSNLNTSTLQYVWDTQNITMPSSGWATFTNGTALTKDNVDGTYYLWIEGSDNAGNIVTTKSNAFTIDNTVPTNPTLSASPTGWTNGNVVVTITYPGDATIKQYSLDAATWNNYTAAVTVSINNTTIYAKCSDAAGNSSGQGTLTVSNIDKTSPTVTAADGGKTTSSVTVTAAASDVGGSGINAASYQYSKDNGATWTTSTSATNYTFSSLATGTYECKVKVVDNAGNAATSSAVALTTQGLGTITLSASPTAWTNGNVTVTITYPSEIVTKQYSLDGTTWNAYTAPVAVSINNTIVYAKGYDAGGNQTAQATLTILNIDKTAPTVSFGTNGASNVQTASTTVTVSDAGGSSLNTSTLQYVWDTQNSTTPSSGWATFTNGAALTKGSVTGTYYLWVKGSDNAGNTLTTKSNAFTIDNTVPTNPTLVASPTSWTNGNVTVTITYPGDATVKQYSLDGSTWNTYTAAVTVSTNNTTVYAKCSDAAGNSSGQGTLTVSNIDKTAPTVSFGTNGASNVQTASTTVTVSDAGGSSLNTSTLQYVWDTQNSITPSSGWATFTNGAALTKGSVTGTYYLWIKGSDNAGNAVTTKSNAFAIDNTVPTNPTLVASPTSWTNGNVTVTITYPGDATVKQYSLDGSTWNTYTAAVTVSTNNTTVYAKCSDAAGNSSGQGTLTISNIDKTAPTVTAADGGKTTSSITVTAAASDTGGSGINASSYQYSSDNGTTWTAATSATSYTFNSLTAGTYQCKVKVVDNAGNAAISSAVALTTQGLGTITLSASPTAWTNGNVTVTITYPSEVVTKQYSLDGTTWNTYTAPVAVSTNGTTVYAKGTDAGGNQTAQATLAISNIDKTAPTVTATDGGKTTSSVTVTVAASDAGGSGLNVSSYQYSSDNGITWTAATSATSYTFSSLTAGTYQCKVKVLDNAGNIATSSAVALTTQGLGTITLSASPTSWTNGNVTVTITYPSEVVTKQYSIDGTTWNAYTAPVVVSTNNTIVYAKGYDAGNNQTAQATLTISNIDKTAPTVSFGTNGASNVQTASTTVTVSDAGGSSLNASTLQYVWDTQNTVAPSSGWTTFTNGSALTKGSVTGTYYLWIKGTDNAGNVVTLASNAFSIDNTVPTNPTLVASPTAWTNGNVTVTITYPGDATVKQYSTDGSTWNTYTAAVTVSTNNTTVYAKCSDAAGNSSGQGTLTISNIDKISPTVSFGTNGASNVQTASTTVTVSDAGGSSLNTSTLQYVWDTQNSITPSSGWATFTNGAALTKGSVTGTYYLWIKGSDNAGNAVTTKSNAFAIDNTVPTNPTLVAGPTSWTNGNVTVTITYPGDATVKQYSIDGTTWNTYTAPVVISTNGTIIYAKCSDAAGNSSGQGTLTISNIDKTAPTVSFGTNGSSTMQTSVSTTASVSDTGGSNINTSTLQYVWDTQNSVAPSSGWATFTNGATLTKTNAYGTYYLWIKGSDNAGNSVVTKSNSFLVSSIESYENGSNTEFSYYNVQNWAITGDVSNTGNAAYWTGILNSTSNSSATTSFNVNVPNDGNKYILGYYIEYNNNTQNDDNINVSVNGTYYYPSYGINVWTYNAVPLSAGTNTIIFNSGFSSPDTNEQGFVALDDLQIQKAPPLTNPTISLSPTAWTNGNVTATISYPALATSRLYSLDGSTWNNYTGPVTISTNNTTIYAKCSDGTTTTQSSVTIANIDKTTPTVSFGTNGSSTMQTSASTTASVSDTGGSNINTSTLQYVWDTQNTTTPSSGWTTFTNGATLTKTNAYGTYYLWIKASDNAGNSIVAKSNSFLVSSIESYENGSSTVFSYYSVHNWSITGDVSNFGNAAYWTGVLDTMSNSTATTSFNVNVPNDGNKYILGYYIYYNNNTQNDDNINVSVNGTYYYPSYNINVWTYNTVLLNAGSNTIVFNAAFASPDINEQGYVALDDLQIQKAPPLTNPVLSASPTAWTSGNVNVTITYPAQATTKLYSLNGTTWYNCTFSSLAVSNNNTTVYAKCSDGITTTQSTLTVTNIDKTAPTVAFGTNGGDMLDPAMTTVTVYDTGGSGVNTGTLQYVWDTQNTVTPSSGWTTFTNGATLSKEYAIGNYYLWIKGADNVGNTIVAKSNVFFTSYFDSLDDQNTPFTYTLDDYWQYTQESVEQGSNGLGTRYLSDRIPADLTVTVPNIPNDGTQYYLSFYAENTTSGDANGDTMSILVNGTYVNYSPGYVAQDSGWQYIQVPINPGTNQVTIEYINDSIYYMHDDYLYVDDFQVVK